MYRSTMISEAEGFVQNIVWSKQFVAWTSDIGVRVYDVDNKCSLGLIKWPENRCVTSSDFRCNMVWFDDLTLLVNFIISLYFLLKKNLRVILKKIFFLLQIGWVDVVRVCSIRRRNSSEKNFVLPQKLPPYRIDIIYSFTTDFYISGIAPLIESTNKTDLHIVLLGVAKTLDDDGTVKRPTLQIVQPIGNDYIEVH
mgnify:FL=1